MADWTSIACGNTSVHNVEHPACSLSIGGKPRKHSRRKWDNFKFQKKNLEYEGCTTANQEFDRDLTSIFEPNVAFAAKGLIFLSRKGNSEAKRISAYIPRGLILSCCTDWLIFHKAER
jgi:hypothetical protein